MAQAVSSENLSQQPPPIAHEETALITGSEAIAVACKLADVDVITAYPIRPYDTVMQYVAKLIANGELDAEYIVAESEHSQFEIVKHASACGGREVTVPDVRKMVGNVELAGQGQAQPATQWIGLRE